MDCAKIGALIAKLRKEKGLTQRDIAEALGVSNKTVSKWECGMGCADLSYWSRLSDLLGVDVNQMMEGEITRNQPDHGDVRRVRFYVCPVCGNILTSTGSASLFCCGRKLEPLLPQDQEDVPQVFVDHSDLESYISVVHPMTKDHYLSFAAYVKNDKVTLIRLYPEQEAGFRLLTGKGGTLYLYCTKHGLSMYKNLF